MSPELSELSSVRIGGYEVPLGQAVKIREHMGCSGSDGKITRIMKEGYEVTCDSCGRKDMVLDILSTIKRLNNTIKG